VVTLAETELAREPHRDVGVLFGGQIVVDSDEPVALIAHVDVAIDLDGLVAGGLLFVIVLENLAVLALGALEPALAGAALAATAAALVAALAVIALALPILLPVAVLAVAMLLTVPVLLAA